MLRILSLVVFTFSSLAHCASNDSLSFLRSDNELTVIVNETTGRSLRRFMRQYTSENKLNLSSKQQDIKINCTESNAIVTCSFHFQNSKNVGIQNQQLNVYSSGKEIRELLTTTSSRLEFENPRSERFELEISGGSFSVQANML